MSYILKALKKLEDEKAARQARPHDINSAILASDRKPGKTASKPAIAAIVALVLAVGGGTFYYLQKQGPKTKASPQDAATEKGAEVKQAQPTSPLATTLTSDPDKKPAPGQPEAGQNMPAPATASQAKSPGASPPPASLNPVTAPLPAARHRGPESAGTSVPGIKVNGIALQDDPAESVAVVNGILARRGMTIQDMRIEEIFHDRVRFSGNGQSYEVYISK